jgi:hypothetical protein
LRASTANVTDHEQGTANRMKRALQKLKAHLWGELLMDDTRWQYGVPLHCQSQDFSLFVTGAAQPKLTMENLGRFKLAVPRVTEQREIAAFIREKDAEFRPLFAQIGRQIETLVAYRKSLIHECVTGQRRITEADLAATKRTATNQPKQHQS